MRRTAIATFMVGALAALGIAASGQLTPGGGLTRVVLSTAPGNLASGSGITGAPLDVEMHTSAPLQGTGSGGSPATLVNASYGDVTVTGGTTWTVNPLPESRITNLTSDLAAKANVSSLATIATTGAAGDLVSGTVPAARMPALTGDVTSTDGSTSTTITAGAVTNAKLAMMASGTVKANVTGSTAVPTDVSLASLAQATALKLGQYGSGADGAFTADGAATTPCLTLAGSTYTANRECAFSILTVNSGITVKPAGWPIFVSGTLTVSSGGSINSDGNAGTVATGGAATWTSTSLLPPGTSGGGSSGVGTGGTATSNTSPSLCVAGSAARGVATVGSSLPGSAGAVCQGGGGGAGGSSSAGTAGNSGATGGAVTLAAAGLGDLQERSVAFSSYLFNAGHLLGTSGGGGGGGFGAGGLGGGGGGGGGWMVIHCAHCVVSGTLSAKGGNGGNGGPASGGIAGGGGGGGGSGGICIIDTADVSAPACSVVGGTGGTGAAAIGGGQPGAVGGAGGAGISIAFTGF